MNVRFCLRKKSPFAGKYSIYTGTTDGNYDGQEVYSISIRN